MNEILESLILGGSFYFSPGLPFLNSIIKEPNKYNVDNHFFSDSTKDINSIFYSTKITKYKSK